MAPVQHELPVAKLARLSAKLEALQPDGAGGDKRVRKRIFAAIGKLKKELLAAASADPPAEPAHKRPRPDGASQLASTATVGGAPPVAASADGKCMAKAKAKGKEVASAAGEEAEEVALLADGDVAEAARPKRAGKGKGGRKADSRGLNLEIAKLAKRKQLAGAEQLFARARAQGIADVHTYTNMINAAVRCGQLARAEALMAEMRTHGPLPNVVAFTALLKGYANVGQMEQASELVEAMLAKGAGGCPLAQPNLRTANTLLRGCARTGDVALAEATVARMEEWGCEADASSYEALLLLLCQALKVKRAKALLASLRAQPTLAHAGAEEGVPSVHPCDNAQILVSLAKAYCLLGQWESASATLQQAREALDGAVSVDELVRHRTPALPPVPGKQGTKGARAAGGHVADVHLSAKSVSTFLAHRRAEATLELETLAKTCDGRADEPAPASLLECFGHTFLFPPKSEPGSEPGSELVEVDTDALAAACAQQLSAAFGMRAYALQASGQGAGGKKAGSKGGNKQAEKQGSAESLLAAASERLRTAFSKEGRLQWRSLFQEKRANEKGAKEGGEARRLVRVEVCSGAGEWVVEHAKHDAEVADWVAMELRVDRSHQIFARMALSNLDNLAILCGDALAIFNAHVEPSSIDALCINHPQPPEWSGGVQDSEGDHLLTPSFLRALHASLRPGGTLAIVTDNLRYGRSLATSLSELGEGALFEPVEVEVSGGGEGGKGKLTAGESRLAPGEPMRVPLYEGVPPASCGYTVPASSYFHRLWDNGNRKRRFFVAVSCAAD